MGQGWLREQELELDLWGEPDCHLTWITVGGREESTVIQPGKVAKGLVDNHGKSPRIGCQTGGGAGAVARYDLRRSRKKSQRSDLSFAPRMLDMTTAESTSAESTTAVLLVAHGSRRAAANQDLLRLAGLIVERGEYPIVEVGYLELSEPSIPEGGRMCVSRGATKVLILPYFLSPGRHVVEDLTRFREQLLAECPGVDFELCPHLGLHPLMVEIVLDRLRGSQTELASRNTSE